MRMTDQVIVAVNILDFRYPWHLAFIALLLRALLKEPRKQKPWTKCDARPRTEIPAVVSYICYNLLHAPLQSISTYSAAILVRDIHLFCHEASRRSWRRILPKRAGSLSDIRPANTFFF